MWAWTGAEAVDPAAIKESQICNGADRNYVLTDRRIQEAGLIGFVIIGVCCTAAVAAYRATHHSPIRWDDGDQSGGEDD